MSGTNTAIGRTSPIRTVVVASQNRRHETQVSSASGNGGGGAASSAVVFSSGGGGGGAASPVANLNQPLAIASVHFEQRLLEGGLDKKIQHIIDGIIEFNGTGDIDTITTVVHETFPEATDADILAYLEIVKNRMSSHEHDEDIPKYRFSSHTVSRLGTSYNVYSLFDAVRKNPIQTVAVRDLLSSRVPVELDSKRVVLASW